MSSKWREKVGSRQRCPELVEGSAAMIRSSILSKIALMGAESPAGGGLAADSRTAYSDGRKNFRSKKSQKLKGRRQKTKIKWQKRCPELVEWSKCKQKKEEDISLTSGKKFRHLFSREAHLFSCVKRQVFFRRSFRLVRRCL